MGDKPYLWCWPTVTPGNGLKYPVVDPDGEWTELSHFDNRALRDE